MQEVPAQVPAIIEWMQKSAFGTGIRESTWTFPVVETTHVLSLAVSVGLLIWFDLRLLGWGMKHQPISQIHKQIMPYVLAGFFIEIVTGFLLFWAEAEKCYLSVFFRAKVLFLFLAAFNAIIFEFRTKKTIGNWDKFPIPPAPARVAGWLSIVSWSAVIVAGRATAYNLF
jgi:hypothetical protein